MIRSLITTAILDANVLYPAPLRDYLLHLANMELYNPRWTTEIQEEWIRSLLLKRPDLRRGNLQRTQDAMDSAFPYASIINYEDKINDLSLPDKKDRHVLAAAIKVMANIIVTFNLKHFPSDYLKSYNIKVQHPDEFITNLIRLNKTKALQALRNQVNNLKNPPVSIADVMQTLENCGLRKSISNLKN